MTTKALDIGKREIQKQEVRTRINNAAIELLTAKSFDTIMVDEICTLAGVARKTFYNYYSSKDELTQSLCDSLIFAEIANIAAMGFERYTTLEDRLCFLVQSIGEVLSEYAALEKTLLRFVLQNISFENGRAEEMKHELEKMNSAFEYILNQDTNTNLPWSKQFMIELLAGFTMSLVINWVNNENYPLQQRIDEWCLFLRNILKNT